MDRQPWLTLSTMLVTILRGSVSGMSMAFRNQKGVLHFTSCHPRDVAGYARALEAFDIHAGAFLARLRPGDLAIFTADHGNDPTWPGTDHTRERVPVLAWGYGAGEIGTCAFVDVAASVAAHLGLPRRGPGRSFLP